MSLDIYLNDQSKAVECSCDCCGNEHFAMKSERIYHANITHNLGKMASEAGIYYLLWRPEEMPPPATKAKDLISGLQVGLDNLILNTERLIKLNPENGWGSYEGLLTFTRNYLNACIQHPEATVEVCR